MLDAIDAVVVTYRADARVLGATLGSLCHQVRTIYLIDNSEPGCAGNPVPQVAEGFPNLVLVSLDQNTGIGHAQNLGLRLAQERGARFTLLSDQDTHYPPDYVERMLENLACIETPERIAALAPCFRDATTDNRDSAFFSLRAGKSMTFSDDAPFREVEQAIASGLLIQNRCLPSIGLMNEALFIDWVDFDWCWRAIASGFRILGCWNVAIEHTLGDSTVTIGRKRYPLHSPIRCYYIVRNGIALALGNGDRSLAKRATILGKALKYAIGFSLFGQPRLKSMGHCLLGLFHGLGGRTGPLHGQPSTPVPTLRPKVSVCLASFNGERFIEAQVASILVQLEDQDELIVSDDGSTDRTLECLAAFQDPRIRVMANPLDKGYTGNFENAIRNATGDLLFLSDQDDIWLSGKVAQMIAALEQADLVVSDARFVDEQLQPTGPTYFSLRGGNQGFVANLVKSRYLGACMAFRRELLPRLMPFPSRRDLCPHDLWITLIGECYFRVKTIPNALIDYRRHGNNASNGGDRSANSLMHRLHFRLYCLLQVLGRWAPSRGPRHGSGKSSSSIQPSKL